MPNREQILYALDLGVKETGKEFRHPSILDDVNRTYFTNCWKINFFRWCVSKAKEENPCMEFDSGNKHGHKFIEYTPHQTRTILNVPERILQEDNTQTKVRKRKLISAGLSVKALENAEHILFPPLLFNRI